jgi:hypothetical protein
LEKQTQTQLASRRSEQNQSSIGEDHAAEQACSRSKEANEELAAKLLLKECRLKVCTGSGISRVEVF